MSKLSLLLPCFLFFFGCSLGNREIYEYKPSEYKSCDYGTASECESKGCEWRITTATVPPEELITATCCPKDTGYNSCGVR